MPISRRNFLISGAVAATLPVTSCATSGSGSPSASSSPAPALTIAEPPPPIELIALSRMGYGPRPGDIERLRAIGLSAYIDEQLSPPPGDDPATAQRLSAATLPIAYEAEGGYPDTDEQRALRTLDQPLEELWQLTNDDTPFAEWAHPLEEVRAATWIRAAHSRWQLRELLVEFWHDHFNVNASSENPAIATWPHYDQVMRRNSLGNFRAFLEEVATSPAMLYYLNNASSQASPANENYARELFELHTLGAIHYFNNRYTSWREVPGALAGLAEGFIDDDVYEAARAFTGWTVADGTETESLTFPNTGAFYYHAGWHDHYQKRVLGVELAPNSPPLADGRTILDLLAAHPGTARHLCTKLCRRLLADDPPTALVERAAAIWLEHWQAPDQIARTVRAILLAPEFAATWGQKVKRPFDLAVSFLRAVDAEVTPNPDLFSIMMERGHHQFGWPAPNGYPDVADYWLTSQIMLGRWNTVLDLCSDWLGAARIDLQGQLPQSTLSARQIVAFWVDRLLGRPLEPTLMSALVAFMAQGGDPARPPQAAEEDSEHDLADRQISLVTLIAMLPAFQYR